MKCLGNEGEAEWGGLWGGARGPRTRTERGGERCFACSGDGWTDGEEDRSDPAWRGWERERLRFDGRRQPGAEAPEREEEVGPDGLVAEQLDVELAAVLRELGR